MKPPETTLQVLNGARKLIEDPDRWTPGHGTVDAKGRPCAPDAVEAARWPADDAVFRWGNTWVASDALEALLAAAEMVKPEELSERGHAAVLAAYDKAIEAERSLERERQAVAARKRKKR